MGEVTGVGPRGSEETTADRVEVRLPAQGAYLAVLRTAAAGLAARLDFTLDDIEDLRIAVDEACALLIPQAAPGADLRCTFEVLPDALVVTVAVTSESPRLPRHDTFAWTVLSALAGSVEARTEGDEVRLVLRKVASRGSA